MANVTSSDTDTIQVELDGIFLNESYYDYADYKLPEDDFLACKSVFIPVLYALCLVVGLLGNGLVLAVLCQLRRAWSIMDTFILHLAVCDTLLLLTLPFWAVEAAQGGSFGTLLYKLMGAIFKVNFYCGIFLLACISLDRYLSIVHAVQMYTRLKPWQVQASCLFVWFFCLLLSIPDWVFLEEQYDARATVRKCEHNYLKFNTNAQAWRLASRLLYHIVGFLLPSVVMVFCYSCILLRLHRGTQGLKKQKAMRVILVLVVAFFICWTPFNLTFFIETVQSKNTTTSAALDKALRVTFVVALLHSLVNPLLYTWLSVPFRMHGLHILRLCKEPHPDQNVSLWDGPVNSPKENGSMNTMTDRGQTCY